MNGFNLAGLGKKNSVLAFVREESKQLWQTLMSLQVCNVEDCCRYNCKTVRGVWISGCPGVGKSTELFGWGMYMATRQDKDRKNMLWVHETMSNFKMVKVVDGVIYTTTLTKKDDKLSGLILELIKDCTLILLDAVRDQMKNILFEIYSNREDAIIALCTSYQSSRDFSDEQYHCFDHFEMKYTMFSWTLEDYKAALNANPNIFNNISMEELEKRFYYSGGNIRHMSYPDYHTISLLDDKILQVSDCSLLLNGLGGVAAPTAINSLIQVRPGLVSGIVSQYVAKELSKKVSISFILHAKEIGQNNPVFLGWIFEIFFFAKNKRVS